MKNEGQIGIPQYSGGHGAKRLTRKTKLCAELQMITERLSEELPVLNQIELNDKLSLPARSRRSIAKPSRKSAAKQSAPNPRGPWPSSSIAKPVRRSRSR